MPGAAYYIKVRHLARGLHRGGIEVSQRFQGLDGLRGIAASIVFLCHSGLIFQAWAGGPDRSSKGNVEPWVKAVDQSPLHAITAGGEAVFVFFILSGFVLLLPFLRAPQPSWVSYYPKRLLRLYLPIVAAVVLAALMVIAIPRIASPDQTWWVNSHAGGVTLKGLLRDALTLVGTGWTNSVLWSLKWEIIFSLMLPLYVAAVVTFRRWWVAGTVAMILASTAGLGLGNEYLQYLPMFGIGAFLTVGKNQILEVANRRPLAGVSMVGAATLLSAVWIAPWLPFPRLVLLSGCTLLVIAFMVWKPALRLSGRPVVAWLGSRSFSLYLVHEPIIVSAAFVFPGSPWLALGLAWPVALLTAEMFFRIVEDPSRRLANRIGLTASGSVGRWRRSTSNANT